MIRVEQRFPDEKPASLLRRFKKRCEREGLIADIKKTEYFEKPSVARRLRRRS